MTIESNKILSEKSINSPTSPIGEIVALASLFMPEGAAESWSARFETEVLDNSNGNKTDAVLIFKEVKKQLQEMDVSGNTDNLGALLEKLQNFNNLESDKNFKSKSALTEVGGLEAETVIWRAYLKLPIEQVMQLMGKNEVEILKLQFKGLTKLSKILAKRGWRR